MRPQRETQHHPYMQSKRWETSVPLSTKNKPNIMCFSCCFASWFTPLPKATAATVKITKVFLRRNVLTLSRVMPPIFRRLPDICFCNTRHRWWRPSSEGSGFSESSLRKRLVLFGGFSFIISSNTWSKRGSWETVAKKSNRKISWLKFILLWQSSPSLKSYQLKPSCDIYTLCILLYVMMWFNDKIRIGHCRVWKVKIISFFGTKEEFLKNASRSFPYNKSIDCIDVKRF